MVPTLAELAQKSVTISIDQGLYRNIDYQLDPRISDEMFSTLLRQYHQYPYHLHNELQNKFNLSEINVKFYPFSAQIKQLARTHNLTSFSFYSNSKYFNLIGCLKQSLNQNSRRNLKHLDMGTNHNVPVGWAKEVGQMLPNLKSLTIDMPPISDIDCTRIFLYFPNLKILNLGKSGASSLFGISNLENLEVLMINDLNLETHTDLMPIFGCHKLKMLDLSKGEAMPESRIMENYLKCAKVLENLQFLDCIGTDIDGNMMNKLIETHTKLRHVSVFDTVLEHKTIAGVSLLNSATGESILNSLQHYISMKNDNVVDWILRETVFSFLFHQNPNDSVTLGQLIDLIYQTLETFDTNYMCYDSAIPCLRLLLIEENLEFLESHDLLTKLIHTIVDAGIRWIHEKEFLDSHAEIWTILHQSKIINLMDLDILKVCNYGVLCIRCPFLSLPLNILPILIETLEKEEFAEFQKTHRLVGTQEFFAAPVRP